MLDDNNVHFLNSDSVDEREDAFIYRSSSYMGYIPVLSEVLIRFGSLI